jgi:hypothetical protein
METPVELKIEDVAARAGTDVGYVRRLIGLGVIGPEQDRFSERDAHVVALLQVWERAGLSAESILSAIESGELSLDFWRRRGGICRRRWTARTGSSPRSEASRSVSWWRFTDRSVSLLPIRMGGLDPTTP